jgi:hypothetical protein
MDGQNRLLRRLSLRGVKSDRPRVSMGALEWAKSGESREKAVTWPRGLAIARIEYPAMPIGLVEATIVVSRRCEEV